MPIITLTKKPAISSAPLALDEAQRIAASVVGPVQWNGAQAHFPCPGIDLHTTQNNRTDCKVLCETTNGVSPGVYCFHGSCREHNDSISRQVRSALGRRGSAGAPTGAPIRAALPVRPRPVFDPAKLAAIAARLPNVNDEWFAQRSAKRVADRTPASFLHELYRPGERVVVFDIFESQGQHVWTCTAPPYDARELDGFTAGKRLGVWFLANPVTGHYAIKDSGDRSRRAGGNVTSWRYLVLESDQADPAHWLSMLAQKPLPIAAIYASGVKSIHALIQIDAESKEAWDAKAEEFKSKFLTLGADPGTITAVRLTRLPCCERLGTIDRKGVYRAYPKPQMQRLIYLNPTPDNTPICERKPL